MTFDFESPPRLSGNDVNDIIKLHYYIIKLINKLKFCLSNLDSENISNVNAGQLSSGTIDLDSVDIRSGNVTLSNDIFRFNIPSGGYFSVDTHGSFEFVNSDKSKYISCNGSTFDLVCDNITAGNISCSAISADSITSDSVNASAVHASSVRCGTIQADNYIGIST